MHINKLKTKIIDHKFAKWLSKRYNIKIFKKYGILLNNILYLEFINKNYELSIIKPIKNI